MLYNYKCNCGCFFEQINSYKDRHIATCTLCKSTNVTKLISIPSISISSCSLRDKSGESIYCPNGGYYDTALRKRFNNVKEKKEFMDKHDVVSMGDSDAKVKKERNEYHDKKMATDNSYKDKNSHISKGENKWAKSQ